MECAAIVLLIVLNLRGVKESVKALLPVFLIFLATQAVRLCVRRGRGLRNLQR